MDCSLSASSVHEILQARILEWSPLGDLPESGIEPMSPASPALHVDSLSTEPFGKPHFIYNSMYVSIPISQFIPPPPLPARNHKFVFYICDATSLFPFFVVVEFYLMARLYHSLFNYFPSKRYLDCF